MGQGIWFALSFIKVVCDAVIEIKQEFTLISLVTAELFNEHKIL